MLTTTALIGLGIAPAAAADLAAQSRIRQDVDIVTARINYKFSGY